MRSLKFALAAMAATRGARRAHSAEPVKIRMAWVAPVSNWASIVLEKKDLAKHLGKSYTLESIRFAGTPPMITAIANGELEVANLAYSTLPARDPERQHRRPARHRRRIPGRRRRLLHQRVLGADGRPDQEGRGPQGQGGRDQRRRQRRRHRLARDAAQARPRGQARLHHRRGAVPHHEGDAEGEEGRSHPVGAAVLVRSRAEARFARCCSPARTRSASRSSSSGRRASPSSTRTAPPWSISWRTCCASSAGSWTRRTTTRS